MTLFESAMDNSKHILSEESLKRMPTLEVFWDIGSNLLSKESERVLAAAVFLRISLECGESFAVGYKTRCERECEHEGILRASPGRGHGGTEAGLVLVLTLPYWM
jgi:hypothetical protein